MGDRERSGHAWSFGPSPLAKVIPFFFWKDLEEWEVNFRGEKTQGFPNIQWAGLLKTLWNGFLFSFSEQLNCI